MSWLKGAVDRIEKEALAGPVNTFTVRKLADVALLLVDVDVSVRANQLLAALPDTAFIAGAITNIPWTPKAVARLRAPSNLEATEKAYPRHDRQELLIQIRRMSENDRHLALALDGRFDEALDAAESALAREEVGDVAAVLGEFEAARRIAADPRLEDRRRPGILWVVTLEQLRQGRTADFVNYLLQIGPEGPGPDACITFALIEAGRVPWGGYPFPDW